MSKIINGKDLKPGDKYKDDCGGLYIVIRHVIINSPIPELAISNIGYNCILSINFQGKFTYSLEDETFTLIECLHDNLKTTKEEVSYKDLKPGDMFSGLKNTHYENLLIAIKQVLPNEGWEAITDITSTKTEGILYWGTNRNKYYITDLTHQLYRYKSSFGNTAPIQTDVFDASMWGGTCLLCGAPSHQGLIGKPQCSSEKCILH